MGFQELLCSSPEPSLIGLDVEQGLLRGVVGTPKDPLQYGKRLAGKDSLHTITTAPLNDLPTLLRDYRALAERKDYKKYFGFVDYITPVRSTVKDSLDTLLLAKLTKQPLSKIWLAAPDRINYEHGVSFRYDQRQQGIDYPDLYLPDYLDVKAQHPIDIETLRNDHAYAFTDDTGQSVDHWTIYRCLYAEVTHQGKTYLLNNGSWYEIAQGFQQEINKAITNIPLSAQTFPAFDHADEATYNAAVAKATPTMYLMDKTLIRPDTKSPVEFCDLCTKDGTMIHVKHYSGSSTLSHLFSQGLVSGTLFYHHDAFRAEAQRCLPAKFQQRYGRDPKKGEYTITYAIITRSKSPLDLPFFSKVTLRAAARDLTSLGYTVNIATIADNKPTKPRKKKP